MGKVFVTDFDNQHKKVRRLLDASGLRENLAAFKSKGGEKILIKPNIVNSSPPPVTTPCWLVAELVDWIKDHHNGFQIIVADGTGEIDQNTLDLFRLHGYLDAFEAQFLDLNEEECKKVTLKKSLRWQEMWLPTILFDSFLISVPVLKAHTLAGVTLSLKNMIGVCPPWRYQKGGHWKKSAFHYRIHQSILDLNFARCADFVLLDATVGLAQSHLGGPECSPPVNKIVAGADPVAVDAYGTALLGKEWRDIGHIRLAHGLLGRAEPLALVPVGNPISGV